MILRAGNDKQSPWLGHPGLALASYTSAVSQTCFAHGMWATKKPFLSLIFARFQGWIVKRDPGRKRLLASKIKFSLSSAFPERHLRDVLPASSDENRGCNCACFFDKILVRVVGGKQKEHHLFPFWSSTILRQHQFMWSNLAGCCSQGP